VARDAVRQDTAAAKDAVAAVMAAVADKDVAKAAFPAVVAVENGDAKAQDTVVTQTSDAIIAAIGDTSNLANPS
jgi:hypothetical protein